MGLFGSSKKRDTDVGPEAQPGLAEWVVGPAGPLYPPQPPNVVVQHYYIAAPASNIATPATAPASYTPPASYIPPASIPACKHLGSVVNMATDLLPMSVPRLFDDGLPAWHAPASTLLNQGAALYDQVSSQFGRVLTLIDGDRYEGDLAAAGPAHRAPTSAQRDSAQRDRSKAQTAGVVSSRAAGRCFAKVDRYANARLPFDLPPMHLYLASYKLLSLAARYADRAYEQPQGAERQAYIDADWRAGTKAMVIKSVPVDDTNVLVFAIRGTAHFMDWAVNLNTAPTAPDGFLDDGGNLCHAGFLSVARRMVRPVAARLRQLLAEDPGRAAYSLLITGHSAGGAVASLLYAHMLASAPHAASELNRLTGFFRRVHCVTFGTPPVSLLPLATPDRRALKKSLFFSFVNEGDPVVRADKAYVKSLLDLFARPEPRNEASEASEPSPASSVRSHDRHRPRPPRPVWNVPPATLSNGGRLVVLRSGNPRGAAAAGPKTVDERLREGVVAQFTTDAQLRGVVWGDPVCHVMKLYAGRIEALAIAAMVPG